MSNKAPVTRTDDQELTPRVPKYPAIPSKHQVRRSEPSVELSMKELCWRHHEAVRSTVDWIAVPHMDRFVRLQFVVTTLI